MSPHMCCLNLKTNQWSRLQSTTMMFSLKSEGHMFSPCCLLFSLRYSAKNIEFSSAGLSPPSIGLFFQLSKIILSDCQASQCNTFKKKKKKDIIRGVSLELVLNLL